jgi:hypothetical protein
VNDFLGDPETDQSRPASEAKIRLASGTKISTIWRGIARASEPTGGEIMRDTSSDDNSRLGSSATLNGPDKPEGEVREIVRSDPEPEGARDASSDTSAKVQMLVQRASSLGELKSVIQELQRLHDFLHTEGERIEREISKFAEVHRNMTNAVRAIENNIVDLTSSKNSSTA